ncbi:hypothetical protein [Bartonella sp. MM73XJBT]|nr:hypothetical protein [Bartonella sp. MM73XJBT]
MKWKYHKEKYLRERYGSTCGAFTVGVGILPIFVFVGLFYECVLGTEL